jgi:hypothetical protein
MPFRTLLHSILIALCVLLAPTAWAQNVKLETTAGNIVIALDAAKAPKTVDNFVQYVKAGHYDGTIFHRVIPNFMIQGGGMTADRREKPTRAPIPLEAGNGLVNTRGTVAMARTTRTRPPPSSSSTSRTMPSSTRRTRPITLAMLCSARWCPAWTWSIASAPEPPAPAIFPTSRW